MNDLIEQYLPVFFPLFFVALWLTVTTILGLLSGWFGLMARYPDQAVEPTLRIRGQSGLMGLWVGMNGILSLSVCPSGLRVGMMRVFGPFCRNFFVPWEDIAVVRRTVIVVWPVAELRFGTPVVGKLRISAHVADRLARAALGRWPEAGPFPKEKRGDIFRSLLVQWAAATCFAALFFYSRSTCCGPEWQPPTYLDGDSVSGDRLWRGVYREIYSPNRLIASSPRPNPSSIDRVRLGS